MFSATVMTSTNMKCWWTIPMPSSIARLGDPTSVGVPASRISPSSAATLPDRMLISVVLPAPFSPSSAWTSPRRRSKSIASLATVPG
jgi:hypothetical protein